MRRHILMALTVGFLIGTAGEAGDDSKKELQSFQGAWVLVSAERDGKKDSSGKGTKLVLTGNKYALTQESSAVIGHFGTFSLDLAKKPKTIDVTVTDGPDKGKTFLGIYELAGDDYKVCFSSPGKERPKELTSKPGSGNLLQIWKREKK